MHNQQSDEELMWLYANNNQERAFDQLYERHKGPLYRYLLKTCREQTLAQETFQELWMKVIRHRNTYQRNAAFATWLYAIARNLLVDVFRKRQRAPELSDTDSDAPDAAPLSQPASEFEHKLMAHRLSEAIAQLPFLQQEVFLLHHDSGLSMQQIAEVTGAGVEAIKSRHRYALARLRTQLGELQ